MQRLLITITFYLLLALSLPASVSGQMPRTAKDRLGVDIINLSSGKRIYGVVLNQADQQNLTIAVERDWFKRTHPKLYESYRNKEITNNTEALEQLTQRIKQWDQIRADDRLLSTFLQDEQKRIQSEATNIEISRKFIVPIIPKDEIRNVFRQTPERRKIAGLAWQNGLANPTTTSTTILKKRLEEKQVDIIRDQVNLANEVPPMAQTKKQWAAKVALVEHVYRPSLEYQGTGSTLIRKGEELNTAALLGQLLGNQNNLVDQLAEQLGIGNRSIQGNTPDWWKTARQGAEEEGCNGVFVIRMKQDYSNPEVTVEGHFFAKDLQGNWFEVVRLQAASNVNNESHETLERLRQEPQIKKIFDTLGSLGLAGGNAQVELALRHGAATQTSLTKVREQFDQFLSTYTEQLDLPAVPIK